VPFNSFDLDDDCVAMLSTIAELADKNGDDGNVGRADCDEALGLQSKGVSALCEDNSEEVEFVLGRVNLDGL
jgi:hypothetical protein